MATLLNTLIFASVCITLCFGATFYEGPNKKAAPGKCLPISHPEVGEIEYGKSVNVPKKCIQLDCHKDGSVVGKSCGSIGVPDGCVLDKPDLSKPYPDCCPKIKCK